MRSADISRTEKQISKPFLDKNKSSTDWMKDVVEQYPTSLLVQVALTAFNDALIVMKVYAGKDMFVNYYGVESGKMTYYSSFLFVPWLFKMLIGILVDARLVSKRKYYSVLFGVVSTVL